jgi:hypothetical protein
MALTAMPVDTRRLLETQLIEKAWKAPDFRKDVVRDPKGMLEKHLGKRLPDQLRIVIHEEDSNTLHFSVPPSPTDTSELSDEELEKIAGGTEITFVLVNIVVPVAVTVAAGTAVGSAAAVTKQQGGW